MKETIYTREGQKIWEKGANDSWYLLEHFKSINAAKRKSRELQGGAAGLGSGILRVGKPGEA
jgi:hypothetical protein